MPEPSPEPQGPADCSGQTLPTQHVRVPEAIGETRVPDAAEPMVPPPAAEQRTIAGYTIEKELAAAAWAWSTWRAIRDRNAPSP